jgi:RimJ/RimL family protein N-acetyltransferase
MIAPTLQTARLTLRPMVMDDFPAYAAFLASDRSVGMGGPYDPRAAWGVFCHDVALWALVGHGGLMIDTASGQTVGQVGINAGPLFPETELGWFLYAGHEGQGYATEAAMTLRDWGFGVFGLATLFSYVTADNAASARVAIRMRAQLDPEAPRMAGNKADLVYRHARPA